MPKDAKKNVDRYKVRGGDLNEFEFRNNQAEVKEASPGNRNAAKSVKGAAAKKSSGKKAAKKTKD